MNPLFFLTARKAKNKFLELLHRPFRLIVTFGFILLIIMNLTLSQNSLPGERPMYEFFAVVYAFYIFCFTSEIRKGFHSGGTMFSMADVNLIFLSPIKPIKILMHGMLSRLGSSLFIGLAFIYQFSLLRSYYPITAKDMIIFVAGYAAVLFISQLAGMLIYFFTCGEMSKIKKAKAVITALYIAFFLLFSVAFLSTGVFSLTVAANILNSSFMKLFPVAGWIFAAAQGIATADAASIVAGALASAAFVVLCFVLIAFSKHGYYEDVVLSAEKGSDSKADEGVAYVKTKHGSNELKSGRGASVIFYKHMLENRRMRTAIFSPSSLVYLVMIGVYGVAFDGGFIILFSLSCMASFLPVLSGKWLRELTMPHVYMIPEPPFKKLFYILPEMLPKIVIESVLQCALIGYICDFDLGVIAFVTLARISVSFVLIGTCLVVARIFREREKNSIFLTASVLPGMVLVLPSAFVCAAALYFGMGILFAFSLMTAVNVLVFLVLLFFARNLLKISE